MKIKWTEGCVTERTTPRHELLLSGKIQCTGCGKIVDKAHFVDPCWRFCSVPCFMQSRPMVLTGDESKLNQVAEETALNRCSGRGRKRKKQ